MTLLLIYFVLCTIAMGIFMAAAVMAGLTSSDRASRDVPGGSASGDIGSRSSAGINMLGSMKAAQAATVDTYGKQAKEAFLRDAEAMFDAVLLWREMHPDASLDEFAALATPGSRVLARELLERTETGGGRNVVEQCPMCGAEMSMRITVPKRADLMM